MNPHLMTDPTLAQVLHELRQREPIFHRPEFGTTRQDFEQMMDPAFWEVGASGRRYSREYVLDTLEKRAQNPTEESWEAQDFQCLELDATAYLLTYTLIQGERVTRRSTIWRKAELGWQILYHQGTIVEN
jgi:hypothetical protein